MSSGKHLVRNFIVKVRGLFALIPGLFDQIVFFWASFSPPALVEYQNPPLLACMFCLPANDGRKECTPRSF